MTTAAPGIGGTRLCRLVTPGVIGDPGVESTLLLKYDARFADGDLGESGPSDARIGTAGAPEAPSRGGNVRSGRGAAVCSESFGVLMDESSSASEPSPGDIGICGGAGRAMIVSVGLNCELNLHSVGTGGGKGLPPGTGGAGFRSSTSGTSSGFLDCNIGVWSASSSFSTSAKSSGLLTLDSPGIGTGGALLRDAEASVSFDCL